MRRIIFLFVLLPFLSFAQKPSKVQRQWAPAYYETPKSWLLQSEDRRLKVGIAAHKNHPGIVFKVFYADPFYITAKQNAILKLNDGTEVVLGCRQTAAKEPMHKTRGDFFYFNYAYYSLSDEDLVQLSLQDVKSIKIQLDGDAPLIFKLKGADKHTIRKELQDVQKKYLTDRDYNYDY